jgi:hypothetical protein
MRVKRCLLGFAASLREDQGILVAMVTRVACFTGVLFKKIQRVEANMFVFFIALMVQALLERLVRQKLRQQKAPPLKLYPEDRDAPHPTTSQIFKTFDGLSAYSVIEDGHVCEEYRDPLKPTHLALLALINMKEDRYWNAT